MPKTPRNKIQKMTKKALTRAAETLDKHSKTSVKIKKITRIAAELEKDLTKEYIKKKAQKQALKKLARKRAKKKSRQKK